MRITLVSAHYPPNFVSGGTLQPQRLARGLRARGHEVSVFAGYLDSVRRPLESWEEQDPTGLPVRWVVSTPFMDWADDRNYDNPGVADVFADHLREHPADVVHLHALQTLGIGLLEVAKAAGAATVVTMHDFWWVCARQFLVDRTERPCSLVVTAGDCPCEDGRPHLLRRAARLSEALRHADLVLAPSASAARVLEANGVPSRLLSVDENGMEVETSRATPVRRSPGEPVVARYTGGSNPMKGPGVLLDALHELGPRPGLRVLAHDLDEAVERDGRRVDATCLELLPPYVPEELDGLMATTDVLLLPSIMRESHSLVTREALLRGVPVLATDTIGPEEVVIDGRNGMIVPAAEPHLLAAALRRLEEPDWLQGLQDGAQRPPPVRSVDEQLDGLERRYRALVAGAGRPAEPWRPARVLFLVGIDGAPARYRAHLPAEALGLHGVPADVRHYRDPDVEQLAAGCDVIVVYRVPATIQVLDLIGRARRAGAVVLFDVDDLIFDPDIVDEIPAMRLLSPDDAALWLEGVRRYRTTLEACDAYIGSTPQLVEHARSVVGIDAHLFENGVGTAIGAASDISLRRPRRPGPPRVGYFSGTTTHDDDWRHVEEAVVATLEHHHPDAELWLGGHLQPTPATLSRLGARVRRLPFLPWHELPDVLRDLDVNLAPLEPGSRFNDAKSAIKWLEAALVGVPTIASPSAPFVDVSEGGAAGWLADDPSEWAKVLDRALSQPDLRTVVGARARRAALLRWSPHLQGERYLEVLASTVAAAAERRRSPAPAWTSTVHDEPIERFRERLEPYPPELAGSIRRQRRPRRRVPPLVALRVKRARLAETWNHEGPTGALRGAGRVATRVVSRVASSATRGRRRRPGP